ncbi:hypothetical protein GDO81_020642 [Engystomops pustulosus]|uniref:Uncharacterized protein n=1 Tax=Engystomops pustulosus TaxID=76066 RepID=A0AAV6ZE14_ENGPU|nr:hypothetical protein GDO81_020642 [Engystomops pustulosus]
MEDPVPTVEKDGNILLYVVASVAAIAISILTFGLICCYWRKGKMCPTNTLENNRVILTTNATNNIEAQSPEENTKFIKDTGEAAVP